MAKKTTSNTGSVRGSTPQTASTSTPSRAAHTQSSTTADSTPTPAKGSKPVVTSSSSSSSLPPRSSSFPQIAAHVWNQYLNDTPSRTLLLDVFMAFLVFVGAVQFLYCLLVGNYPFNAFLSGFSAAVGQFVLTASLRMQTSERSPATASAGAKTSSKPGETVEENPSRISSERAFADYVLGSLILHGFCINFIN